MLGDRVLVMSPRPGRVLLDVPVEISETHGRPLAADELRATEEFREIREQVAAAILR